jgi:hypothetical protein
MRMMVLKVSPRAIAARLVSTHLSVTLGATLFTARIKPKSILNGDYDPLRVSP